MNNSTVCGLENMALGKSPGVKEGTLTSQFFSYVAMACNLTQRQL